MAGVEAKTPKTAPRQPPKTADPCDRVTLSPIRRPPSGFPMVSPGSLRAGGAPSIMPHLGRGGITERPWIPLHTGDEHTRRPTLSRQVTMHRRGPSSASRPDSVRGVPPANKNPGESQRNPKNLETVVTLSPCPLIHHLVTFPLPPCHLVTLSRCDLSPFPRSP